jgi:hypothetical protein
LPLCYVAIQHLSVTLPRPVTYISIYPETKENPTKPAFCIGSSSWYQSKVVQRTTLLADRQEEITATKE